MTYYMLMQPTNKQLDQLSEFHEKVIDYKDLFKPPTLVTMGSLALVMNGCRRIDTVSGVNQIVLGRTGDLLDGYIARLLDQSSDLGALADTAADKLGMAAIVSAAWHKNAVPKMPLSVIAGKQLMNIGLTALTAHNHPHQGFRPTMTGKYAMAADNAALVGYLYSNALAREYPELNLHQGALVLGRVGFAAGSALAIPTTLQYTQRAFNS